MITRRTLLAGLAVCPACAEVARAAGPHWTYEGHGGPEEWGSLDKEFQACSLGTQQSPVNLQDSVRAEARAPLFVWSPATYKVANNGHTIQLDADGHAGIAETNGKTYWLRQFHFHAPSEHAVNGQRTAMEAHFVHAAPDGGLLVAGVFLVPGTANPVFTKVMAAAPKTTGTEPLPAPLDPTALLPTARDLYRYEGSLTTPPCSEVVDWNVFAAPVTVAQSDIDAFRTLFPMNARPLQQVNRRFLLQLN